ncbi:hypothetical protein QL285_080188 [Trifolium repens]|nr:hypothetical protein QL285_080188 [Trifolium repens]
MSPPPIDLDLNIPLSCPNEIPDLNLTFNVEDNIPSNSEIHEEQQPFDFYPIDSETNDDFEQEFEQPDQHVESVESEAGLNSNDEKWFYMTKKSMNYYMLPGEDMPERNCKSKNFIGKVMFLVAVARPRYDSDGNETFSGKIGVFPFVTKEIAMRTSVNRVAGTLETKPITSVNRDVSRKFLLEKVIPAIKEKWPRDAINEPIIIQQDNARCHINENDSEFCQIAKEHGFDIRLMCQPPNSPDLNILDLGFFRAIQSLQYKETPKTIDELIEAVVKAFESFLETNKIFLTLQTCMIEIMKTKGSNKYDIPHIKKDSIMQQEGQLPTQIKCDPSLVEDVISYLRINGNLD